MGDFSLTTFSSEGKFYNKAYLIQIFNYYIPFCQ